MTDVQQRPFRFGLIGYGAKSRQDWVNKAQKAEALGYNTLSV